MIDSFLSEIGKKFAERLFALLMLPGLAFVVTLYCAGTLRYAHALDLPLLVRATRHHLDEMRRDSVTIVVVGLVTLLAAAGVAGAVRALARLVEKVWLTELRGRPTTRLGERLQLLDERVQGEYHGLRADLVWPRLWLLLDDGRRIPIESARTGIDNAALLYGWSALYLAMGIAWWPALAIGAVQAASAWSRARRQVHAYATLVESVIDVSQVELANALGLELKHGMITEGEAGQINARLGKGRPTS